MRTLWLVAPLVLLCPLGQTAPSAERPVPPVTTPPPPTTFEEGMMVRFHMHENYGLVRGIEKLILTGRLDEAKKFAEAISQAADEPGLGAVTTQAVEVRRRAAELAKATSIEQAAQREAALVAACAGCHTAANVVPEVGTPPSEPPDGATLKARMARHAWAADRLWDGIMADDDHAWLTGLDVLASSTPVWSQLAAEQQGIARRLQTTAETERRTKATQLSKRASAYGKILTLCASCHTSSR